MFKENTKKLLHVALNRQSKRGDVGLELEMEGHDLPSDAPHWTAKSEGSLIDGMEYITKPLKADAVKLYVDNLHSYITSYGGTIKPSYRCSTHIHVNFLNDPIDDMLGTYFIFTMFEPVLLTLCGNNRNGNLFCLSSYDTGDIVSAYQRLCQAIHRMGYQTFNPQRGKYSALNYDRLYDLGTLEARCFPLSVDGATVQEWVNWLMNMKQMAHNEIDKTYRQLWKNVRQNPYWYARQIFGDHAETINNLPELMDLGTMTAYELSRALKKAYSDTTVKAKKTVAKNLDAIYDEFMEIQQEQL